MQQQGCIGPAAAGLQLCQPRGHQVGDHLGVGVREEGDARRLQLLPQAAVVFDDAVLHHRQLAAAIEMGVGVALLGPAVGGPAGVADAAVAGGAAFLEALAEVHQLAFGPQAVEGAGAARCGVGRQLHGGDAGGVVAAVLQLA